MKIRTLKRRRGELKVELTPLIDIVFLLLIFFMVATTFEDLSSSINIELPTSSSKNIINVKSLEVRISEDLSYQIVTKDNEGKVALKDAAKDEIKGILDESLKSMKNKTVVISADKKVSYQSLVEVLDIAKSAGAKSLDLNIDSAS